MDTNYDKRKILDTLVDLDKNKTIFTADKEKLNDVMKMDGNFSGIVDGLTELDQYLN